MPHSQCSGDCSLATPPRYPHYSSPKSFLHHINRFQTLRWLNKCLPNDPKDCSLPYDILTIIQSFDIGTKQHRLMKECQRIIDKEMYSLETFHLLPFLLSTIESFFITLALSSLFINLYLTDFDEYDDFNHFYSNLFFFAMPTWQRLILWLFSFFITSLRLLGLFVIAARCWRFHRFMGTLITSLIETEHGNDERLEVRDFFLVAPPPRKS